MKRRMRVIVLIIVLLLVAAGAGLRMLQQLTLQPLPLQQDLAFEIAPGQSYRGVLQQLVAADLLSPPEALGLRLLARLRGTQLVQAGEYTLTPGLSGADALALFRSGRVTLHALRLVEGWNIREALSAVRSHPAIRLELAEDELAPERLLAALGLPPGHAEGRLRPETYHFPRGTTDAAFLRRAVRAQTTALEQVWAARVPDLPLADGDAALVLASIIEKETGIGGERREVAGVFVNRLRLGMKLQTDPTVIYGLGTTFDGNLRRRDLESDTPYNTYTRTGLPPTPICLPGTASLQAAVNPASTDALFFVARGDGSGRHAFSRTLAEHNRAVQAYLKRLREARTP